jgi:transcriptional regulator with XRE-family HTH domain
VDSQDPRQLLARRLRALREETWPGRKITQLQLAQALGGVSVPLISSWESQSNPRIPPLRRLNTYAALFATPRSFNEDPGHLISPQDMTDEERQAMDELKQELLGLRNGAMRAVAATLERDQVDETSLSLSTGPWRFEDGNDVTIVCAPWPQEVLEKIPYAKVDEPDFIELLTYSELDSMVELFGHLRATNPTNQIKFRTVNKLAPDDYTTHLVTLGGIDWNTTTSSAIRKLGLPVRQVADWHTQGGQYFEVEESGTTVKHRPVLEESDGHETLSEDVALFARAVNPFNRKRTITICNGMYGRGTYGAIRALTDKRFRDRNAEYVRSRFGGSDSYCILTRVRVVDGTTLTPDWTLDEFKLFEWAG